MWCLRWKASGGRKGIEGIDYGRKEEFQWISVIRLPDFVKKADFDWAVWEAETKKKQDFSKVEFLTIEEGLCVQCMHIGAFDEEPRTIALMDTYLKEKGYINDFSDGRMHHEIYLSDARRVSPEMEDSNPASGKKDRMYRRTLKRSCFFQQGIKKKSQ